jgi:sugar-specific transcriptional regulator TrmB
MTDNLIQALQDRGMSEKEAKVYLTVLELGSAPASTIATRSGLKRVTSYSLLKDLERRGIAHSLEKEGVSNFHVIDPKQLSLKLQDKVTSFDAFVPELLAMTDTYNNKPKIEYFEDLT